MKQTLQYERLEINENKCRYSFNQENSYDSENIESFESLESFEKLVSKHLPKEYSFSIKDLIIKAEKSEINFFKTRIEHLNIKERIVLTSLNNIRMGVTNDELEFIKFDNNENKNNEKKDNKLSNTIFQTIDKMVHKTLHKKKMVNGKEIKECIFYDDLKNQISDLKENSKFNEFDKTICHLKDGNKYFEFITIKSLIISITNLITELIQKYLKKIENLDNKKSEENEENKKLEFDLEKIETSHKLDVDIFQDIFRDFLFQGNTCSELEEYFIYSLDNFREKYQMNFTLSELYTDIFLNSIFHNKKLCSLYIDSYLNEELYGDNKIILKRFKQLILTANIPLKHQIVELLGLHQIEIYEKNDLITLIVSQKNIHHKEIVKFEKERDNLHEINIKKEEEKNLNINKNNEKNNNLINNNNMKEDENNKFTVIKANDISAIKHIKNQSLLSVCNNNNMIINKENNNDKKENKENKENKDKDKKRKENNKNYINKKNKEKIGLDDIEHKTVDEIYNYINDDKIVKTKKKKRSRKNKKNKKEVIIVEENPEEIEDSIVIKFKEDLSDKLIHAGSITKIKPIISENWIKIISNYD